MKLSKTIDQTRICKKSYGDPLGYFCMGLFVLSSRYVFSWYPFYFDFRSARIIFYVSSGFYLWNINNTKADIC